MSSSDKGARRERELVNEFSDEGYAAIRTPASGAATERELPDILVGNGENTHAIEAKSSGSDVIYIDEREIINLKYFANKFCAEPLVGVKFDLTDGDPSYGRNDRNGWYFLKPEEMYTTSSGNYRVKKDTAIDSGKPFFKLVNKQQTLSGN